MDWGVCPLAVEQERSIGLSSKVQGISSEEEAEVSCDHKKDSLSEGGACEPWRGDTAP